MWRKHNYVVVPHCCRIRKPTRHSSRCEIETCWKNNWRLSSLVPLLRVVREHLQAHAKCTGRKRQIKLPRYTPQLNPAHKVAHRSITKGLRVAGFSFGLKCATQEGDGFDSQPGPFCGEPARSPRPDVRRGVFYSYSVSSFGLKTCTLIRLGFLKNWVIC